MSGLILHTLDTISNSAYEQLVKRTPDGFRWWGKRTRPLAKGTIRPRRDSAKPRLIETLLHTTDYKQFTTLVSLLARYHMTFEAELAEIDQERRDRKERV